MKRIAPTLTRKPSRIAGAAIRPKPMPQDFIAVISLDEESRPNVRRLARSIDIGNVHMTTPGRLNTNIFMTDGRDAP